MRLPKKERVKTGGVDKRDKQLYRVNQIGIRHKFVQVLTRVDFECT